MTSPEAVKNDRSLVEALKLFNRKERFWLIQEALGCSKLKPQHRIPLHSHFRTKLDKELSIKVPPDAWWAMDYHFDWIYAALHVLKTGLTEDERPILANRNPQFIMGNQQDCDLIVAFEKTLIVIEAKTGVSDKSQLVEKFERWESLLPKMEEQGLASVFIYASRTQHELVKWQKFNSRLAKCNPLELPAFDDFGTWRVVRCNSDGKKASNGEYAQIRRMSKSSRPTE